MTAKLEHRVQVRLSAHQLRELDRARAAAPYAPDRGTFFRQVLVDYLAALVRVNPEGVRKAGGA